MGVGLGNAIAAIKDPHIQACLMRLARSHVTVQSTLSTLVRNAVPVTSYALSSLTITAGNGLTGGGTLAANRTINVASAFGLTITADDTSVNQAMVPTWTGVHTYSAQDVHNAGVSLGLSGVLKTAAVDSATVPGLDHQDTVTRTQGFIERSYNTVSGNQTKIVSWDGRISFGYQASLLPQTGHRLSFLDDDTANPAGAPVYVGILGNHVLQALPVWELFFTNMPEGAKRIATDRVKWSVKYQKKYGIDSGPASELPDEVAAAVQHLCKRTFRALELSGYARIDLRMDGAGNVWILEANPNPQIARGEDFAASAEKVGLSYEAALQRIINLGLRWQPESVA